jgi:hypothetical protein
MIKNKQVKNKFEIHNFNKVLSGVLRKHNI